MTFHTSTASVPVRPATPPTTAPQMRATDMRTVTLSRHAYAKINGDAELARAIFAAAEQPSVTYPSNRVAGQMRHIRNGFVAIMAGQQIVTFYRDVVETDLRPDQTDVDAVAYAAKRVERAKREHNRQAKRDRDRALTYQLKGKK